MLPARGGVRDKAGSTHERLRMEGAVLVLSPGFRSSYSRGKALTSAVALSMFLKHASNKSGKIPSLRRQESNSSRTDYTNTLVLGTWGGVRERFLCCRANTAIYHEDHLWHQTKRNPPVCLVFLHRDLQCKSGTATLGLSAAASGLPRPKQARCPWDSSWRLAV